MHGRSALISQPNQSSNYNSNTNYTELYRAIMNNSPHATKLLSFYVRNSFLICNFWKLVMLVPRPMRSGSDTSCDGTAKLKP